MPGKQCPNGHNMRELQSRCAKCGWQEGRDAPDPGHKGGGCTWDGCNEPAAIRLVDVSKGGYVYREIASYVFDKHGNLMGGYSLVAYVGRCAAHYYHERDNIKLDWREEAILNFQAAHPEFRVKPSDEGERRDIVAMAKSFALRPAPWESNPDRRAELQRRLDEMRQRPSMADTMPDSTGGTEILVTA